MCNWAEVTTDLIILAFRVKIFQTAQKFSKKRPYVSRDELSSKSVKHKPLKWFRKQWHQATWSEVSGHLFGIDFFLYWTDVCSKDLDINIIVN